MLKNMYSMALLPPYIIANGLFAAVKYLSVNRLHDHDGCLFSSLCGNIIIFMYIIAALFCICIFLKYLIFIIFFYFVLSYSLC